MSGAAADTPSSSRITRTEFRIGVIQGAEASAGRDLILVSGCQEILAECSILDKERLASVQAGVLFFT